MTDIQKDPFFDYHAHLKLLPDTVLRDIALNDCAGHDYRKGAVEVLLGRKSPIVKHPDLQRFVTELNAELDGIEFEHPDLGPGPLVASITTETLQQIEEIASSPFIQEKLAEEGLKIDQEAIENLLQDVTEAQESISGAPVDPEVSKDVSTPASDPVSSKSKKQRKPKEPSDAPTE